jgi:hypothetical protein
VTAALILLAAVVIAPTIRWIVTPTVELSTYAQFIISPVAGIVGLAVGYYFGRTSRGHSGS